MCMDYSAWAPTVQIFMLHMKVHPQASSTEEKPLVHQVDKMILSDKSVIFSSHPGVCSMDL